MICPYTGDVVDVVGGRLATPRLDPLLDVLQLAADKVPHLNDAIFRGSSKDFVIKTRISVCIDVNWKQSRDSFAAESKEAEDQTDVKLSWHYNRLR